MENIKIEDPRLAIKDYYERRRLQINEGGMQAACRGHSDLMKKYRSLQYLEMSRILDEALNTAIEQNDVQYIIKHKDRETAEESVTALSEVANALLAIAQSIDENK
jgi:hypothetical protein